MGTLWRCLKAQQHKHNILLECQEKEEPLCNLRWTRPYPTNMSSSLKSNISRNIYDLLLEELLVEESFNLIYHFYFILLVTFLSALTIVQGFRDLD